MPTSRGPSHHLSGDPGYQATTCFGIVHLHRPDELSSSAPCRACQLAPERAPRQDQDPFRVRRANAVHLPSPGRLPPPSPVQPAPHLRTRRNLPGRHWYPGFATEGPASDTLSRPVKPFARPNDLPAIHRSRRATCRPSTSATERSTSTPNNDPNPTARCDGKPPRDRWPAPLRDGPAELPQARDRSGFSALSIPPTTTARRRGFTPT